MYLKAFPEPGLRNIVEYFWCLEEVNQYENDFAFQATACTKIELQFHYCGHYVSEKSSVLFKSGFHGQRSNPVKYITNNSFTGIFGVRLKPLAFLLLFGLPAYTITNHSVSLLDVISKEGAKLEISIFDAKNFEERIKIMSQFIIEHIKPIPEKYKKIDFLLSEIHQCHEIKLAPFIETMPYSLRQFERDFKIVTGFSLKTYQKIYRFEHIFNELKLLGSKPKLTDLALNFGYYDQAHFNHQFKELSGLNPSDLFDL